MAFYYVKTAARSPSGYLNKLRQEIQYGFLIIRNHLKDLAQTGILSVSGNLYIKVPYQDRAAVPNPAEVLLVHTLAHSHTLVLTHRINIISCILLILYTVNEYHMPPM